MDEAPRPRRFPTTEWSLVLAAGDPEQRDALATLCEIYWPAVYAFVRSQIHDLDAAQDLTQGFFARLLEKGDLRQADRSRGRFRSFLLACVKHYVANERERDRAAKRGGGRSAIPLDLVSAEAVLRQEAARTESPDRAFDRRYALTLLRHALARFDDEQRRAGRSELHRHLRPFLSAEGGDASYAEVARQTGMSEGAVKVAVHRARRRLGAILRQEVARTLDDPAKVEDELRHLMASMSA